MIRLFYVILFILVFFGGVTNCMRWTTENGSEESFSPPPPPPLPFGIIDKSNLKQEDLDAGAEWRELPSLEELKEELTPGLREAGASPEDIEVIVKDIFRINKQLWEKELDQTDKTTSPSFPSPSR